MSPPPVLSVPVLEPQHIPSTGVRRGGSGRSARTPTADACPSSMRAIEESDVRSSPPQPPPQSAPPSAPPPAGTRRRLLADPGGDYLARGARRVAVRGREGRRRPARG